MSDLSIIPLQDGFETQLSQEWDGAVGTVYVLSTPTYTPTTTDTYIVVSPGKTNMQIARVSDYDSTAKTLTIDSISFNKALGVSSTAQTHPTGSKVIISDNYQFWADIQTAINSKVDGNSNEAGVYKFADATARDAFFTSPTNGLQAYLTTEGYWTDYVGGAWVQRATGATPNASATVAGKVEIATSAESIAGTDTGGTGALLSVLPSDIAKNIQSGTFVYGTDVGGDDTYIVALTPALTTNTNGSRPGFTPSTTNTGACTVDFGAGALNIKTKDGNDPQSGVIRAGKPVKGTILGTEYILDNEDFATTANKGVSQLATDTIAETGSNTTDPITSSQLDKYTISTSLRSDWFTYSTTWKIGAGPSFEGWTGTSAGGLATASFGYCYMRWGTLGNVGIETTIPGSLTTEKYSPATNKDIRIKFFMKLSDTSDRKGVGLCLSGSPTTISSAQTDITNGLVRFVWNAGVLYAQNSNGTAATSTDISSGVTATTKNEYVIIFNPGVDAKFYVNGVLKATHTTNLPTTGTQNLSIGVSANDREITISNIIVSIEN